jgi:hypothetical protein
MLRTHQDYNIEITYHTREAIMVVDAWSWRSPMSQLVAKDMSFKMCEELNKLNLSIIANTEVMKIEVDSTLL